MKILKIFVKVVLGLGAMTLAFAAGVVAEKQYSCSSFFNTSLGFETLAESLSKENWVLADLGAKPTFRWCEYCRSFEKREVCIRIEEELLIASIRSIALEFRGFTGNDFNLATIPELQTIKQAIHNLVANPDEHIQQAWQRLLQKDSQIGIWSAHSDPRDGWACNVTFSKKSEIREQEECKIEFLKWH